MRREVDITITDDNRDHGKHFVICEASAADAEWWAMRAFMALARAGVEVEDEMKNAGAAGMAKMGLEALGKLHPSDAKPLLDEIMDCVWIKPDPVRNSMLKRKLMPEDIEEIVTRFKLRMEVIALHTGFSMAAAMSTLTSPAKADSSDTPTFRAPSARASQVAGRRS